MSIIKGRPIVKGVAEGEALVSPVPLAFCAGVATHSGEITDITNPIKGQFIGNKVLIFPSAKGSSAFSKAAFALSIGGNAPCALVVNQVNPQAASGAIVLKVPTIVELDVDPATVISTGDWVRVDADAGTVEVLRKAEST